MLSRVADCAYWMSRYLERAEHTARLGDVHPLYRPTLKLLALSLLRGLAALSVAKIGRIRACTTCISGEVA